MAKQKKKRRRASGKRRVAAKGIERAAVPVNPLKKQLELVNALRPHAERVRERLLQVYAEREGGRSGQ